MAFEAMRAAARQLGWITSAAITADIPIVVSVVQALKEAARAGYR